MSGKDYYNDGVTFDDIYTLFKFDRDLRNLFLKYFASAEATLKTVSTYEYCCTYKNIVNPYLNSKFYTDNGKFKDGVLKLVNDFKTILNLDTYKTLYKRDYITHYVKNYECEVPLWVLMNALTFGQAYKFYCFQNDSVKNKIAKEFSMLYKNSHNDAIYLSAKTLEKVYARLKYPRKQ